MLPLTQAVLGAETLQAARDAIRAAGSPTELDYELERAAGDGGGASARFSPAGR